MAGQARRQTASLAPVASLLILAVGIGVLTNTARADDCLTAPNSPAPEGSHWYYHIDRATQGKCWHVRATDQPAEQTAAPTASDASADASTAAPRKPATSSNPPPSISPDAGAAQSSPPAKPRRASVTAAPGDESVRQSTEKGSQAWSTAPATASTPMATIPGDSTPSLPRVKVLGVKSQDAPVSGATADQPGQQSQKDPLASRAEVPPGQPSSSLQAGDQATVPASATDPAWPGPAVTSVKTPRPAAGPSDTRLESGQPRADVRASDDAGASDDVETTAQDSAPVPQAEIAKSPTSRPIAMFAVATLGLAVAGLLMRVVVKISSRRRQPVDRRGFDWVENRYRDESGEDQIIHQPGLSDYLQRSATSTSLGSGRSRSGHRRRDNELDGAAVSDMTDEIGMHRRRRIDIDPRESDWIGKLVDDMQSSLVPPSHYRSGSPLQDGNAWPNDEGRNDRQSEEIRKREDALKQLKQDLDRLLQSPKVA
jgi:hypothetical protein